MASIAELKKELSDFANYKISVSVTASYLAKASSSLGNISSAADNNYSINNGGSNISEGSQKLKNSCFETSNYLKNTVVPAIDSKMDDIELEIKRLEEEERRRQAEAAAAAKRASTRPFWW